MDYEWIGEAELGVIYASLAAAMTVEILTSG